jgi:hypothetical protein
MSGPLPHRWFLPLAAATIAFGIGFLLGRTPATFTQPASATHTAAPLDAAATAAPKAPTVEADGANAEALSNLLRAATDRNHRTREHRMIIAIESLRAEDIPGALAIAERLNSARRTWVLPLLITRWAEFDPEAAARFALDYPFNSVVVQSGAITSAMTVWARRDPAPAKAWAAGIHDKRAQSAAITGAALGIAESDPRAAYAWITALPAELSTSQAYSLLFDLWASRDVIEAAHFAQNMPPGSGQRLAITTIASHWAQSDPLAGIAWAGRLPDVGARREATERIFAQWAADDAATAAAEALKLPESTTRHQALSSILGHAAVQDIELAKTILGKIPAPHRLQALENANEHLVWDAPHSSIELLLLEPSCEERNRLLCHALSFSDSASIEALIEQISASVPLGGERDRVLQSAVAAWTLDEPRKALDWMVTQEKASPTALSKAILLWAWNDPRTALDWALAQPEGPAQSGLLAGAIAGLAMHQPDQASRLFPKISDGELQRSTVARISGAWAGRDPAAAIEWAGALGDPQLQASAYHEVGKVWAANEPQATAGWIEDLPPGASRDAAISGFVESASESDRSAALAWAALITDAAQRENVLRSVYESWEATDHAAARRWLDATPALSAEAKKRIQPH